MSTSESCTNLKYRAGIDRISSLPAGIDRISSLPEALHSKILSLLSTKKAVATSILSKRWKFLWTCISTLRFHDLYFKCKEEALLMNSQKFTQFVNSVLLQLNPPCIHNFCLKYHDNRSDSSKIQSLVCAAIQRTIHKFKLHLNLDQLMEMPLSNFNFKTLTVLKISSGCGLCSVHSNVALASASSVCFPNLLTLDLDDITFTIASDCSVSFPSLKKLVLDYVKYTNEESFNKLFASCPVLESLRFLGWHYTCSDDNLQVFTISIPSLRRLVIGPTHYTTIRQYKIQIDTPALEYILLFYDSFCQYFTLDNLSCLLDVVVVAFDSDEHVDSIEKTKEDISKCIGRLVDVRFLSISGRIILEAIGSISENIAPVFRYLTRLEIDRRHECSDWSFVITNMLERTDNLEHLIMKGNCHCGSHESWWMEPSSVPVCLRRRVTKISFTNIGGCRDEFDLVKYFLKNAGVLKLFIIDFSCSSEEKFQLMRNISTIPRESRACQIDFR